MGRAPCCEKVGLKKGRWTSEEDEILLKYIQTNGEGSWRSLPKNAGLLRCGKSCRLRWINYLRADLKRGNISAEEENTIVTLHASFGNRLVPGEWISPVPVTSPAVEGPKEWLFAWVPLKSYTLFRWSLIASHLPGRTDNEIKNYWNSHLSRKIYRFSRVATTETQPGAGAGDTPKVAPIPPKRKGGRTSRWAMKKNKSYSTQPNQPNSDAAVVLAQPTPSLESEGFMVLAEVSRKCEKSLDDSVEERVDDDDVLGLCQLEGINEGGGALGFGDMLESCLAETCGVSNISEERETNDVVGVGGACHNKIASSESKANGESGEWYSCSSMASGNLDQDWDWESVIEFNNNIAESEEAYNREHQEKLLTWLWEDDDWESDAKKLGETDHQIQNDMVAWFLS